MLNLAKRSVISGALTERKKKKELFAKTFEINSDRRDNSIVCAEIGSKCRR